MFSHHGKSILESNEIKISGEPFHEDDTKSEDNPSPSQSWSQNKGIDGSVGKYPQSQKKIHKSPIFGSPRHCSPKDNPSIFRRALPKEISLITMPTLSYPWKSKALVFLLDVNVNKHQIKQSVKELYDIEMATVNTLIRPNGKKKSYVLLALDYDALDAVNKTGTIWAQQANSKYSHVLHFGKQGTTYTTVILWDYNRAKKFLPSRDIVVIFLHSL